MPSRSCRSRPSSPIVSPPLLSSSLLCRGQLRALAPVGRRMRLGGRSVAAVGWAVRSPISREMPSCSCVRACSRGAHSLYRSSGKRTRRSRASGGPAVFLRCSLRPAWGGKRRLGDPPRHRHVERLSHHCIRCKRAWFLRPDVRIATRVSGSNGVDLRKRACVCRSLCLPAEGRDAHCRSVGWGDPDSGLDRVGGCRAVPASGPAPSGGLARGRNPADLLTTARA
jgi:hypothetical protein